MEDRRITIEQLLAEARAYRREQRAEQWRGRARLALLFVAVLALVALCKFVAGSL